VSDAAWGHRRGAAVSDTESDHGGRRRCLIPRRGVGGAMSDMARGRGRGAVVSDARRYGTEAAMSDTARTGRGGVRHGDGDGGGRRCQTRRRGVDGAVSGSKDGRRCHVVSGLTGLGRCLTPSGVGGGGIPAPLKPAVRGRVWRQGGAPQGGQ
jgi:hypothetical protein